MVAFGLCLQGASCEDAIAAGQILPIGCWSDMVLVVPLVEFKSEFLVGHALEVEDFAVAVRLDGDAHAGLSSWGDGVGVVFLEEALHLDSETLPRAWFLIMMPMSMMFVMFVMAMMAMMSMFGVVSPIILALIESLILIESFRLVSWDNKPELIISVVFFPLDDPIAIIGIPSFNIQTLPAEGSDEIPPIGMFALGGPFNHEPTTSVLVVID